MRALASLQRSLSSKKESASRGGDPAQRRIVPDDAIEPASRVQPEKWTEMKIRIAASADARLQRSEGAESRGQRLSASAETNDTAAQRH